LLRVSNTITLPRLASATPRSLRATEPHETKGRCVPEPQYQLVRDRLIKTRARQHLTLREAAEKAGVSAATLSRFERGASNPDLPTVDRLIDWLELDRSAVFAPAPRRAREKTLPDQVAVMLRADRNLDPGIAQALSKVFKTAYDEFTKADAER
jgi:transcriptional regulator with XRE-family HTH domain